MGVINLLDMFHISYISKRMLGMYLTFFSNCKYVMLPAHWWQRNPKVACFHLKTEPMQYNPHMPSLQD